MAVQADAYPIGIGIPKRTAGVGSGIGVDTGFQSEAVNVVGYTLDAVWETFGVGLQYPLFVAVSEEAVVDVDVPIADIFQSERYHGFGLPFDEAFVDVDAVSVPRTPTHDWWFDGLDGLCIGTDGRQKENRKSVEC